MGLVFVWFYVQYYHINMFCDFGDMACDHKKEQKEQ